MGGEGSSSRQEGQIRVIWGGRAPWGGPDTDCSRLSPPTHTPCNLRFQFLSSWSLLHREVRLPVGL